MRRAWLAFSCLGYFCCGCEERPPQGTHTIDQFVFITTNTTIFEVTNRLGVPDAITGSGVSRFEYHLSDRSHVRIWPNDLGRLTYQQEHLGADLRGHQTRPGVYPAWGASTSTVIKMWHGNRQLIPQREK